MSIWSLTYQQSIFKRYHTDRHFSEFLPTRWRQKSTGIDMEQNYVAVTLSIISSPVLFAGHRTDCAQLYFETHSKISRRQFGLNECCSWSGSSCHSSICRLPVSPTLPYCDVLLKKVAHTRLPSVGSQSWSRFLAVSLQVTWVINQALGCHYFPPGVHLPPQPLRGLLPTLLLGEQRHNGCEQFAQDCYSTASRLRFEPGSFCAWVRHANHSAINGHVMLRVLCFCHKWYF